MTALRRNLGALLFDFFGLYGVHFNYANTGISLRKGGTYFSKRERGPEWFNASRCSSSPPTVR